MSVSAALTEDEIHLSRRAVGRVLWTPVHRLKSSAPHRSRGAVMADKKASPDYPIHEPLAERWSPYAFADRRVQAAEMRSLFEAARWASSSYNEQPWRYIVATKANAADYERLLSCLVEGNQVWARA